MEGRQISFPNSNRIGKYRIMREFMTDDENRPILKALQSIVLIIETEPDETGRGTMFYAASDLFEPIAEGGEIPEYRLCWARNCHFEREDYEAKRIDGKAGEETIGFVAIRKIVIHVPPATLALYPKQAHLGRRQ